MSKKTMVMFRMPDGTEVSNDPRFDLEEALTKSLNSRPTTGSVGITWDEQQAQTQAQRLASIQSGQPGVGENATVDDATRDLHGPLGSPAQQRQAEDAQKAKEVGASPKSTSVDDDDPVDSNERVLEVRKAQEEARKSYQKALEKLGEEGEGDPEKPFSEWSPKQLMAEIKKRNADRAEEEQIQLSGKKKADAVQALEADDEAQASGNPE